MFPFDLPKEISGIERKHWEEMDNNIYVLGTEEMCVVWLTKVTHKKFYHFSISPELTLFPELFLLLCPTYVSVLKSSDSELFRKGT